jgi:hypothetical protein
MLPTPHCRNGSCRSLGAMILAQKNLENSRLENSHHASVFGDKMYAKHLLKRVLYCRKFCSRGPTYSSQQRPSHPCHRVGPWAPGGGGGSGGAIPPRNFGRSVNPISIGKGADYAVHIINYLPLVPNF